MRACRACPRVRGSCRPCPCGAEWAAQIFGFPECSPERLPMGAWRPAGAQPPFNGSLLACVSGPRLQACCTSGVLSLRACVMHSGCTSPMFACKPCSIEAGKGSGACMHHASLHTCTRTHPARPLLTAAPRACPLTPPQQRGHVYAAPAQGLPCGLLMPPPLSERGWTELVLLPAPVLAHCEVDLRGAAAPLRGQPSAFVLHPAAVLHGWAVASAHSAMRECDKCGLE